MKLSYDDLNSLHDNLCRRFENGLIDVETYCSEWDDIVVFAGWTWDEVLAEIGERWMTRERHRSTFEC